MVAWTEEAVTDEPTLTHDARGGDAATDVLAVAVKRLSTLPADSLTSFIAELERLKALAWLRLMREALPTVAPRDTPLDELRHVSPAQVAELLNLKEPYVHELCRSRKLPATKRGKYWIIPVAGLREWLTYRKRDVDRTRQSTGDSPDRPPRSEPLLRLRRPRGRHP